MSEVPLYGPPASRASVDRPRTPEGRSFQKDVRRVSRRFTAPGVITLVLMDPGRARLGR